MGQKMVIIDGNSLVHRAFYALPTSMKLRATGQPTNAIYGFFTMLFRVIDQYAPDYVGVAFDKKDKTFRHQLFGEYKAGRRKTPEELISQFPILKDALTKLGVRIIEKSGFEADDILGTMAKRAGEMGVYAYIVTGDKDAFQLISDQAQVLFTRKGVSETEVFDLEHLKEVYGLVPKQIIDLKSLMGDSSDNIPGVPGVGEKTALKLLGDYPSLEEVYGHIGEMPKNKLREKLENNREQAELSKTLATIDVNSPIDETLEDLAFSGFQEEALREVLSSLEFHSLLKRKGIEREPSAVQTETMEVKTSEELEAIVSKIQGPIAVHLTDEALFFASSQEREYKITTTISLLDNGFSEEEALKKLAPLLAGQGNVVHNGKKLMHGARQWGIQVNPDLYDVMIGEYVLNPTARDYSLEKLRERYMASGNAACLFDIGKKQQREIEQKGLSKILYEIELPLMNVLYTMEIEGFKVDVQELKALSVSYQENIQKLEEEIHTLTGNDSFNIASTKQLGAVLFEELELPAIKRTKRGYSTDIEVLEKLYDRHPVIPAIIEYRQQTKIKSTYLDGLLAVVNQSTGKVHTTFNQVATATGRISSTEPNLQNIPVRSPISREIRQAFIPRGEDRTLVAADYSQIELRVLAHIADDQHMKDAFLKDEDIHRRTAAEVLGIPQEFVTPEMRSSAKAVNFGIVYGISDFGLAKSLGIPKSQAGDYIRRYLEEFSGVRQYMEEIVEKAKRDGYVKTIWGRVRYIDELKSANYNTRSFGERAALNTPIQGTAADIIKAAMIGVYNRLTQGAMKSKLILQVHDELIVDAYNDELEQVKEILRDTMENVCQLSVPLKVNVAWGKTWEEAK